MRFTVPNSELHEAPLLNNTGAVCSEVCSEARSTPTCSGTDTTDKESGSKALSNEDLADRHQRMNTCQTLVDVDLDIAKL